MSKPFILLTALLLASVGVTNGQQKQQSFIPGEIWPDNKGIHINAHGGGILPKLNGRTNGH